MGTNITGIGNANAIGFKSRVTGGIYFPPELKDALVGVWSAYGKSNDSTDRNIIKNKIKDRGGDFVISNAAFKLNSGFGGFVEDFTSWDRIDSSTAEISNDGSKIKCINTTLNVQYLFNYINRDISSFKVKISNFTKGDITYYYRKEDGIEAFFKITPLSVVNSDKVIELPKSYNTVENGTGSRGGFYSSNINIGVTIEQIPSFEGAFVTDGINDLITSTKTVQEMLGGSNEITVVSMMANLDSRQILCNSNFSNVNGYNVRNTLGPNGVISMLGYTDKNGTTNNLNLIMGDKDSIKLLDKVNFNSDYVFYPAQYYKGYYQVAWYWTIIANKVLTTDQINQVIAYFNLDKTLKPDMLCNITKQGITNDNHADFNDKLIDYSGNGRDIQMYNLAWKGGSGVAAKKFETIKDYLIVPDEGLQELTIYNEFSYKVKSIKHADRYWTVQSLNKTDVSYPITIIADKDIIWRNALNYTDENGVKGNIRKETNVPANTPTQVFILGFNDFDVPDNYTKVNCVSYATRTDITEFTVTFIPSCKGGMLLDGITDFGQFVGDLGLKDYTLIMNRAYNNLINNQVPLISSNIVEDQTPFIVEHWNTGSNAISFSYGASRTTDIPLDINKKIVYQSTYSYMGYVIPKGNAISTGGGITLGKFGNGVQYSAICLWSLMLFPYSMSEFLIERQLKKHKLGTLYPDMVEFRPVIKSNASYDNIVFYYKNEKVENGTYLTVGSSIGMHIRLSSNPVNEIKSITVNGIPATFKFHDTNNNIYQYDFNLTSKPPQKINITIDEYIRYEDIVQPYPSLFTLIDYDTEEVYSWGSKLKIGTKFKGNVINLLPDMYEWQGDVLYNGEPIYWNTTPGVVAKEMVFSWNMPFKYLIDNNEPKVILSPRLLRIPNSSYKILGYIPDISGHGNHGKINNSAYAEGSGVNEDGSYQFDGVDDFVTIPTTVGGKQVLMKVNWNSSIGRGILYDQRGYPNEFAIYNADVDNNNPVFAYQARNNGQTYIDSILNKNIKASELRAITHNITITNELSTGTNTSSPVIGSNRVHDAYFTNMALYDFMLFDEISTEAKIKELNTYIGITPKVTLPNYYWDNYGKKNTDANRGHVDEQVSLQKTGTSVNPLENFNISYEGMSGYNGYPVVFGASKTWESLSGVYGYTSNATNTTIHVTHAEHAGDSLLFSYVKKDGALANIKEIPAFRVTVKGLEGNSKFGYRYLATEDATEETLVYLGNGTHELAKSFAPTEALLDLTRNAWVGIFITPMVEGEVVFDCDITIEVLPEYENGLAYDGVSDFSQNTEIEIIEDFTFLVKGSLLKGLTGSGGCIARKGDKKHYSTGGYAFIYCFDSPIESYRNSYYSFGKSFVPSKEIVAPPLIGYMTKTNVNGETTTFGTNSDIKGIIFGNWSSGYMNMVIYKSILYTKTISLLEINFLKNLMEKDEIIDINHPIFISNTEDESNTSQDT